MLFVELAGEIRDIWPVSSLAFVFRGACLDHGFQRKPITIVQGDSALLNATYPDKFRSRVEEGARARGIELILSDYIDTFEVAPISNGTGVKTRRGAEIEADLVVSLNGESQCPLS